MNEIGRWVDDKPHRFFVAIGEHTAAVIATAVVLLFPATFDSVLAACWSH